MKWGRRESVSVLAVFGFFKLSVKGPQLRQLLVSRLEFLFYAPPPILPGDGWGARHQFFRALPERVSEPSHFYRFAQSESGYHWLADRRSHPTQRPRCLGYRDQSFLPGTR